MNRWFRQRRLRVDRVQHIVLRVDCFTFDFAGRKHGISVHHGCHARGSRGLRRILPHGVYWRQMDRCGDNVNAQDLSHGYITE